MAKKCHPDAQSGNTTRWDFREVSEAYQTMSRFYETRSELGNFATDYHEANNEWTVDQEDYEYEQ